MADTQQRLRNTTVPMPVPRAAYPRLTPAEYNRAATQMITVASLRCIGVMPTQDDMLAVGAIIFAAAMDAADRSNFSSDTKAS